MIRILYHSSDGRLHLDWPVDALASVLLDQKGFVWVDLVEEPRVTCEQILRDTFDFHPLAVDDALEETHVPKIDDWQDYVYLVLHAICPSAASCDALTTLELDCFIGPNYLVTYQSKEIHVIKNLWSGLDRNEHKFHQSATRLLYVVADTLVMDTMRILELLDEQIDGIEDRIFAQPTNDLLAEMFTLKRTLLRLRRILSPQREVLNKLARGDFAVINAEDRIYFRDVYDHLVRLYDITDSMRDLVSGALDTYLSVVNNRMNDVMKTLTVITTLFMPLSFLVGFFGMNFFQSATLLPVWTGRLAFGITLAAMALIPVGMYLWMRKRAWL